MSYSTLPLFAVAYVTRKFKQPCYIWVRYDGTDTPLTFKDGEQPNLLMRWIDEKSNNVVWKKIQTV